MERRSYKEMITLEDIHWWFISRRMILQKVIDQYFQKDISKNILEIGCGSGGNLQMLKDYGKLHAMELDDEALNVAKSRNICNVKKGKLPNDIPYDNKFDLICLWDVLEHIDEDIDSLEAIRNKLNQKGIIVITVPAYKFLWSAHDVVSQHKRRYNKKYLSSIVSKSGMHIKYATYFNTFLFPIITTIRTLNNIFKNNNTDVSLPSKPLNNLLIKIFSCEKRILPKFIFPFGVSILLIAERTEACPSSLLT